MFWGSKIFKKKTSRMFSSARHSARKSFMREECSSFTARCGEVPVCHTCVTLEHSRLEVEHLEIATRAVKDSLATQLDTAKKSCETMSLYIR